MSQSPIRIGIIGCAGRMGQMLVRGIAAASDMELSAGIENKGHPALGRDAGTVAGLEECGVEITDDIAQACKRSHVFIDFSLPESTLSAIGATSSAGIPSVIGTTGITDDAPLRAAADAVPIVWAPNMSLGVNLLFALTSRAAAALKGYDIEIIEAHHRHKKDAPSGTALRLAEKAAEACGLNLEDAAVHGRQGMVGERPDSQIGIHAVRAGDVVGEHTVLFATQGERVELNHKASSRECFAMGALHAARWISNRSPGLYDMQDVLGLSS